MNRLVINHIIDKQIRLYDYLQELGLSSKLISNIKTMGDLRVNDSHVNVLYELNINDRLEIIFPIEKHGQQMEPCDMDLDIVYEDEYMLIVNKQASIPSIPDHNYHSHTLANGLLGYYQKIHLDSTIHLVTRLDKDTSGLVLVAKYRYIHHLLSNTDIHKHYVAYVEGIIKQKQEIILPIDRIEGKVKRIISDCGKYAHTTVIPLKYKDGNTLVECILHTGRTHQIRVHLSSIKHPLVNDSLYDSKTTGLYSLKCFQLEFIHPITKKQIHIEVPYD